MLLAYEELKPFKEKNAFLLVTQFIKDVQVRKQSLEKAVSTDVFCGKKKKLCLQSLRRSFIRCSLHDEHSRVLHCTVSSKLRADAYESSSFCITAHGVL